MAGGSAWFFLGLAIACCACSSGGAGGHASEGGGGAGGAAGGSSGIVSGPGFPEAGPWTSFYGSPGFIDLAKTASAFRIVNLDADPDNGFTKAQIATLRAGGTNRVISYLNVGSCETFRSYYAKAPPGHASCVSSGALTTNYDGYPDEKWADLSNHAYRDLLVNYVAARLAERGVDGFFLDNLEVVEHGAGSKNGPCDAACSQGGLDLVWELRQAFPGKLIVMQNATSNVTRGGTTHGVRFAKLLDGISHEQVYSGDAQARGQMLAWESEALAVNGRPLWLASEDYVGACAATDLSKADAIYAKAAADGLDEYVTDASGKQAKPCFWSDF